MPHHATRTRSVWIIALALPPLVLLGACGSGDDTQVASIEGPVSTTESAPAANKIDDGVCARTVLTSPIPTQTAASTT
jgi:hypothetical protein